MTLKIKKKIENKNKPRNKTQDDKIRNSSAKYKVLSGEKNHITAARIWTISPVTSFGMLAKLFDISVASSFQDKTNDCL